MNFFSSSAILLVLMCISSSSEGFVHPSLTTFTKKASETTSLNMNLIFGEESGASGGSREHGIVGGYASTPEYDEDGNEIAPPDSSDMVRQLLPDQMYMKEGSPSGFMAQAMAAQDKRLREQAKAMGKTKPPTPRDSTYLDDGTFSSPSYMQKSVAKTKTPTIPFENVQQLKPPQSQRSLPDQTQRSMPDQTQRSMADPQRPRHPWESVANTQTPTIPFENSQQLMPIPPSKASSPQTTQRSLADPTRPRHPFESVANTQTPRIPFESVQQLMPIPPAKAPAAPPSPPDSDYFQPEDYEEQEQEGPVYEEAVQEDEPEDKEEPLPIPAPAPVPPARRTQRTAVTGPMTTPQMRSIANPRAAPAASVTAPTTAPASVPLPQKISEGQVRSFFYLWNDALTTGDSRIVAKRYWDDAMLIGTISDTPRTNYDGIQDYFDQFLLLEPQAHIMEGHIQMGHNWAKDSGVLEFTMAAQGDQKVRARYSFLYTFQQGQWKIAHQHSSFMPEAIGRGQQITEDQVHNLFTLWNDALATGDAAAVTKRYSQDATLLTLDQTCSDAASIQSYFENTFLVRNPKGSIVESHVSVGDNWCKDVGVYEFTLDGTTTAKVKAPYTFVYVWENGAWKISHHHSSLVLPEADDDKEEES